ncbi:MAG: mercuric transport protein periplasmic component [Rubrivivax sp. SCN 70-15]|nr:MAG: mercuric transport protein periplasmic component [Rubrivivax sp. SCN 70-15]
MNKSLAWMLVALLAAPAVAATGTVTLSVPGMDCSVCPITVEKALLRVDGVAGAEVNFAKRLATVSFDDAKVKVEQLEQATRDAGYPSSVVAGKK